MCGMLQSELMTGIYPLRSSEMVWALHCVFDMYFDQFGLIAAHDQCGKLLEVHVYSP